MSKTFRRLSYSYHDSLLERCEVGPGGELTLEIRPDPVWNRNGAQHVRLNFGAIRNFDEVEAFFRRVQESKHRREGLDEIVGIACTEKGKWVVDLARNGVVTIETP